MPRLKKPYQDTLRDRITAQVVALQHEYHYDNDRMAEILRCSRRTYVERRSSGTFTLKELCRLSEFFHATFLIGSESQK